MVKHSTLFQSTIGAALLSTLLLSTSAHAGLLGGGGAAGGFGGGLNGAFTPRSLNLDGQAAGQASRDGALLPSRDAVKDKAGDTVHNGKDAGQSGAAKAAHTQATVTDSARNDAGKMREQAGQASGTASGTAAATAGASRNAASRSTHADGMAQAGGTLSRTAPTATPDAPAAPAAAAPAAPAPSSNNAAPMKNTASTGGGMAAATRRADASASGSGQVSRADRSANADASAQAGVQR
jgi:hypothetical protein